MSEDNKLGQAKKRNKKIKITDIAIEKVPYVCYRGFTEEQNKVMHSLAKLVLPMDQSMQLM